MKDVFIVSDNIVSPLGCTTADNFAQISKGVTGIEQHPAATGISALPYFASLIKTDQQEKWFATLDNAEQYTKFEKFLIISIADALQNTTIRLSDAETVLIISSTKGNIGLLETESMTAALQERIALHASAKKIAGYFKNKNLPIVISNACISGLTALVTGKRLIESGLYKHAVVAGADLISEFVLSGFQSFQAISAQLCKPFDKDRNGINLGEAAATIILSAGKSNQATIKLMGGAVSNDANHISGPSRTGEELCIAIEKSLKQSGLESANIDFISAHGTATIYNDEMEAKAFSLAGMESIPVNSIKGFYGHTLGAAGIVESVIAIQSLKREIMIPTLGYNEMGVSKPINISKKLIALPASHCLKTASGFGGCNAALVFGKAG